MTPGDRRRVLIADDEAAIVTSLEFLMRARGYETAAASDGEAALAQCASFRPDLLLLDLMLPKLNGYDVCRALRKRAAHRGLRIILVSAKGSELDVQRGIEAGADAHVGKPFSTKELVQEVERLLAPPPH